MKTQKPILFLLILLFSNLTVACSCHSDEIRNLFKTKEKIDETILSLSRTSSGAEMKGELELNIPENLITWIFEDGTFIPMAKLQGGKSYSIITDHLGTPTEAYDEEGKKVWSCQLDIYGGIRKIEGQRSFISFRYQGQYDDVETDLYYNRFRYYSPESGTYVSQDPIRLAGGMPNMYSYVEDLNSWIDPFGLSGAPKVFWSGGSKAQAAAQSYAESIGGEVLEMTPQGQALEKFTKSMDWNEAEPLWKKTSQNFAGSVPSTQKHAVVFIDSSKYRGAGSVWESVEKPVLDKKGVTSEVRDVHKANVGCQ